MENNEMILKDLCGRLLHNVKVHAKYIDLEETIEVDGIVKMIDDDGVVGIEVISDTCFAWTYVQIDNVKPYLFPLSSMTEEQEEELKNMYYSFNGMFHYTERIFDGIPFSKMKYFPYQIEEFFNKNHIDYRGLIRLDLAIDATNLNIYKDYV